MNMLDLSDVRQQLLDNPTFHADMLAVAEHGAGYAHLTWPILTGRLVNSIRTEYDQSVAMASVIADTPYAKFVDEGTRFMKARHLTQHLADYINGGG